MSPKPAGPRPGRASVLLVDDHPIVRHGLSLLVGRHDDLEVCGEAGDVAGTLQAIERLKPDLVVVDIALGGADGLELIKLIKARWPALPTLALSMHSETLYARRALRGGARGFLMKEEAPEEFISAIRQILAGAVYVSDRLKAEWLQRMVGRRAPEDVPPLESLTDREIEVLRLIGSGFGVRRIAQSLNLSVKTVQTHQDHLKKKLGVGSASELAHYATIWLQQESGA